MINFVALESISFMDDLIYQNEECYNMQLEDIEEIQTKLIKDSFAFHYENCQSYKNYCKSLNVSPDDIQNHEDLIKIPLLPSIMFKERDVLSCDMNEVVKVCTSSGTKGSISKVYRDEITLNRFLGSIRTCLDQILNLDDAFCINLGPSTEEAGDLWFSYAISVVDMVYPTENFVVDEVFYPERAYKKILDVKDQYENVLIIGAPIMFMALIEYMKENNLKIDDSKNILFITAGGWKRFSGQQIPRKEFNDLISSAFLNANENYFRDILNAVELNAVFPECEANIKHIVPWVKVLILDPITLKPVNDNEIGLIAYLDPSTTSYPCFVLTDDVGRIVLNGKCKCGRCSQGIEIVRRVKSVESRGCALKIDKKYANG